MKKFKTKQFTLILHITVRLDPLLIKRIQRKLLMAVVQANRRPLGLFFIHQHS